MTIQEPTLKDKTARGILWGGLSNGMMQLLNAVFGVVIARILSREDYGLVGMLAIFSTIAASLQESGFVSALTNKRNATRHDYNSVFWFNISVSVSIYLVLWFCAPLIARFFNEPRLLWLSRYAFIGFVVASLSIVPRAILFKQLRVKEQSITSLVALLASGTVGVLMAVNGMAYWGIATQSIVFVLFVALLSWWFSRFRPSFDASFRPIKEMFGFSVKMLITNIFNAINNNVFSILFGRFYDSDTVGVYNQANKWNMMGSQTITGMVQSVAQPMFVEVGSEPARQCQVFRKMLRFTCFISFPAMLGLALVSSDFIVLLLTEKWLPSARILQMLCVAGAFMPVTTLYTNFIISRGKSDVYMYNTISMGLVMILLLCGLHYTKASLLGVTGIPLMVMSYVALVILWLLLWHYFLWREVGLSLWKVLSDLFPFLLIAMVAMVVAYYAGKEISTLYLRLIARVLIAAIVYLALLWLLGAKILRESLAYLLRRHQHGMDKTGKEEDTIID
jgi:O-antigen/teichoic acid export membrane protein